jgi:hypothetical protein
MVAGARRHPLLRGAAASGPPGASEASTYLTEHRFTLLRRETITPGVCGDGPLQNLELVVAQVPLSEAHSARKKATRTSRQSEGCGMVGQAHTVSRG